MSLCNFPGAERLQVDELQFLSRWEGQRFRSVQAGVCDAFGGSCRVLGPVSLGSHSSGGKGLQVGPSTTQYLQTGPTEAPTEAGGLGAFWFLEEKLRSSMDSSVEKPQVLTVPHVRMSEFKARVEDEQEVLVPLVIRAL